MNSIFKNNKIFKIILAGAVISFLWISTFGLLYHMNEMRIEGTKSNCIFGGESNGCAMNFSDHINIWHEIFTIIPNDIVGLVNSILLAILLITLVVFSKDYFYIFSRCIYCQYKLYLKQHPQIKLFNYLEDVFSSGILNTKKYKLATI
jgi:hypothetical protein